MLELHENLKKILQAKNLETFYSEIYGQKIFVYVGLNLETCVGGKIKFPFGKIKLP